MTPASDDPRHAAVTEALAAQGQNLGQIQDGLASVVGAQLADNAAAVKAIKRVVNGKMGRAVSVQGQLSGMITNQLGQISGTAAAPIQQAVADISNAAATGAVTRTALSPTPSVSLPSGSAPIPVASTPIAPPVPAPSSTTYVILVNCNVSPPQLGIAGQAIWLAGGWPGYKLFNNIVYLSYTAAAIDMNAALANPNWWHGICPQPPPPAPGATVTVSAVAPACGPPLPPLPPILPGPFPLAPGEKSFAVTYNCNTSEPFSQIYGGLARDDEVAHGWIVWQDGWDDPTRAQEWVDQVVHSLAAIYPAIAADLSLGTNWVLGRYLCCKYSGIAPAGGGDGGPILPPPSVPPTSPPPPACPPAPPCPTAPVPVAPFACGLSLPDLVCPYLVNGQLPALGTEEWCQCIQAFADWLDGIGRKVSSWIDENLTPSQSGTESAGLGAVLLNLAGVAPDAIAKMVQGGTPDTLNRLQCLWQTTKKAIIVAGVENGAKLLGLALARALLNALEKLRIGWDGFVWATLDISVISEPLTKLLDYIEHWMFQWEIPAVGEAIECYLQHTAPEGLVFCWMKLQGANPDVYRPVIDARREKLSTEEIIQYARRHGLDESSQANALRQQGWFRIEEAHARVTLYNELPTISDHLHWLQRNVFDDQYVTDYQLMDGFEERFWPKFGPDLYSLGMLKDYAALHYAAHWIVPSRGELQEMMFRLRPGRVDDSIVFTSDDFSRLLVEQDVAPWYRERLKAIAYATLPLRQLNQAAQQGAFGHEELAARWQDLGYSPSDAETMAKTSLFTAARQSAAASHGFTAAVVAEMAQYGMLDISQATAYLSPQGFTADQISALFSAAKAKKALAERKKHDEGTINDFAALVLRSYEDGAVSAADVALPLTAAGYSPDAISLAIQTVDLRVRKATVDSATTAVRKAYFLGAVDATGASVVLQAAGVVPDRAGTLVGRWSLEMTVPRMAASTGLILRLAKKGIMSIANAKQRLLNLGWLEPDADLQLAEVYQAIQQAQALAAQRRAKDLAKAQALAQKAIKDAQKASCRIYTAGKMIRWFKLRIIDERTFRARLTQCGYDTAAIDGLLDEAQVARAAADKKAEKSGATGVEYTGQGAVPGGPPP